MNALSRAGSSLVILVGAVLLGASLFRQAGGL